MKGSSIFVAIFLSLIFISPISGLIIFERWYGESEGDLGYSVIQTLDGGYAVAGVTGSWGAQNSDVLLLKTDSLGDIEWVKTYGGPLSEDGCCVSQTSDGGYILTGMTGSYGAGSADVILIKTDFLGNTLWTKTFGGPYWDDGHSAIQTSDEGYIIAGKTESFGAGSADIYIIKTDSLGNPTWTKTFGGTEFDRAYDILEVSEGKYIISGITASWGAGSFDVWLLKIDFNGDIIWEKTYGGADDDWGWSVAQTYDGGYIIGGQTHSFTYNHDIYVVKVDSLGNLNWTKHYDFGRFDDGHSIAQSNDGGYIITGSRESPGPSQHNICLMKIDARGGIIWTKSFGGNDYERGYSVIQTRDGGYATVGETSSFGAGYFDVYFIKTDKFGLVGVEKKWGVNNPSEVIKVYPNPFNHTLNIRGSYEVKVYDVSGKFIDEVQHTWNGKDSKGNIVPPGIYFLKFNDKPVGKVVKVR